MKRVVVVGAGLTGLVVARALERAEPKCEVRLVEAAGRLGGRVHSVRHNAFVLDAGPGSWTAADVEVTRLVEAVGLGDEIAEARHDAGRTYVAFGRVLHPVPERLFVDLASPLAPLLEGELLGWDARLRALMERVVPRRAWGPADDEGVLAFVARRLGPEVAERLADPLFGRLLGGDVASLSVRASAPELVAAEETHGSLLAAAVAARRGRSRVPLGERDAAARLSLRGGMGDLVVNLAHKLREAEVATSRAARRVARLPAGDPRGRWLVETTAGPLHADDVVLAVPARLAAELVDELDAELAGACRAIRYGSSALVFLAFRRYDVRHPLDASGIVVPRSEGRPMRECRFVSTEWDHRAPSGQVLLRAGFDGEAFAALPDRELVRVARAELRDLLGIEREPSFTRVFRHDRTVLQPMVGHLGRAARVAELASAHDGLHLAGAGADTGVARAVRTGEAIAARIAPSA